MRAHKGGESCKKLPGRANRYVRNSCQSWGDQPSTSAPLTLLIVPDCRIDRQYIVRTIHVWVPGKSGKSQTKTHNNIFRDHKLQFIWLRGSNEAQLVNWWWLFQLHFLQNLSKPTNRPTGRTFFNESCPATVHRPMGRCRPRLEYKTVEIESSQSIIPIT